MCTRTSVEDVSEDVQLVDGQSLDDVTDGDDEIVGTPCCDDGIDNDVDVGGFVRVVSTFMQQFLDNIGEVRG